MAHLTVLNRSSQPIVFATAGGDAFIDACGSADFQWRGAWRAESGAGQPIEGAVRVRITTAPPADGAGSYTVVVAPAGVYQTDPEFKSPPPCGGQAPAGASGG